VTSLLTTVILRAPDSIRHRPLASGRRHLTDR
jgi:hypothetical protein